METKLGYLNQNVRSTEEMFALSCQEVERVPLFFVL